MNPKYQIFISSTYEDLKSERDQVIKSILEMGHIPVGMEMFSAADDEQWQIIARQIDQSDYYVVIVAHRYGSMTSEGVSFTEKEYDYAVSQGIPVYGFVIEPSASWPANAMEKRKKLQESVEKFRQKVRGKPVSSWSSAVELHGKVSIALSKAFNTNPRPGWVRATQAMTPEAATELARLSVENAELRKRLEDNPVVFMPEFDLQLWISWDTWEDNKQIDKVMGGYQLHAELENTGNELADLVDAFVYLPSDLVADLSNHNRRALGAQPYEMRVNNIHLRWRGNAMGSNRVPFLPGTKESSVVKLNTEAVEEPSEFVLTYKVHPSRGYSQSGEIALRNIPVKAWRPDM